MTMRSKKKRTALSAFSILYFILFTLAVLTWIIPEVRNATLGTIVMASYNGFADAVDVCFFIMVLSGFFNVVTKTGALNAGIAQLVKRFKGRELVLIPILMLLFSIGGTTFGMAEETIAFYSLITATMIAAGFDSLVGAATVLLGSGVGVIGSTVNPFAPGIAVDSINKSCRELGIAAEVNTGIVIMLGTVIWLTSLVIACWFVMSYAAKLKRDKGTTLLSTDEQRIMQEKFNTAATADAPIFTARMKITMFIVALSFAVMVIGVVPWTKFHITCFDSWSAFLTDTPLGSWWFGELAMWFFLMAIVISVINRLSERDTVEAFVEGSQGVMSVIFVIAVARGASVLMGQTGLDKYILEHAAQALQGMPAGIFAPVLYLLYGLLSFVIPSSSGLATVSMPIMGPLAYKLNHNPAVMVMIFTSASGLLNLFTPTSGVVMGGIAISGVEYRTWLKFMGKVLGILFITTVFILTGAMLIL
ncbi:YfcC family protein [Treponema sp.]|uniref:YfcC family protein n=1 Tax=Treponema sp. TaxID=166 RepID=UPI003FA24AB1